MSEYKRRVFLFLTSVCILILLVQQLLLSGSFINRDSFVFGNRITGQGSHDRHFRIVNSVRTQLQVIAHIFKWILATVGLPTTSNVPEKVFKHSPLTTTSFNSTFKMTRQTRILPSTAARAICSDKSIWGIHKVLQPVVSNMNDWSFSDGVNCPYMNISESELEISRKKVYLNCTNGKRPVYMIKESNDTIDLHVTTFGDTCFKHYIQSCCCGNYRVPNVVHYVWYTREKLDFVTFLSLLSVVRFIQPCLIIFHGDRIPQGHYWDFIIHVSPNIIHMKREAPTIIFGQKVRHKEHSSDVMRIQALIEYGGIYLDTDTVMVRSIESLRKYPTVLSKQSSGMTGSAFIMAERNSTFMQLWLDGYRYHYDPNAYTYNAMNYPGKLSSEYPDLIHVEYTTISRPKDMIGGKIYYNQHATYNWSYIYGIHLYSRIYKEPFNEVSIRKMNFTAGSISRHIVYGNKEMCND